ncbi:hypothetical protein GCM10009527_080950 [Actinomadura nitritigenes]
MPLHASGDGVVAEASGGRKNVLDAAHRRQGSVHLLLQGCTYGDPSGAKAEHPEHDPPSYGGALCRILVHASIRAP